MCSATAQSTGAYQGPHAIYSTSTRRQCQVNAEIRYADKYALQLHCSSVTKSSRRTGLTFLVSCFLKCKMTDWGFIAISAIGIGTVATNRQSCASCNSFLLFSANKSWKCLTMKRVCSPMRANLSNIRMYIYMYMRTCVCMCLSG